MIVRKLLVTDGSSEREVTVVGTLVVGRDPACQLNALDPLLSRRHAEFVSTSHGVTIRDLKSRNGILVNGHKVPEQALKSGDVIQLGHLHMQYVEESVAQSPEDSARFHATTATGFELPTIAPPARPAPAGRLAATATSPTATAPAPNAPPSPVVNQRKPEPAPLRATTLHQRSDEIGIDLTAAPAVRHEVPSSAISAVDREDSDLTVAPTSPSAEARPLPQLTPGPRDAGAADPDATRVPTPRAPKHGHGVPPPSGDDTDMTMAPVGRESAGRPSPVPAPKAADPFDIDATRAPRTHASAAVRDADVTRAPLSKPMARSGSKPASAQSSTSFDETGAPTSLLHANAATPTPGRATEAHVVADASLIITEASATCPVVIGARPETLVGALLADAISRSVRFVATGDGPASLSLSIARASSGKTITVTFKAGQTTENPS